MINPDGPWTHKTVAGNKAPQHSWRESLSGFTDKVKGKPEGTSSIKTARFSRHVRELFIFLVVVVALINLSSLYVIDSLVKQEDQRVVGLLHKVIVHLHAVWANTPPAERPQLDNAELESEMKTVQLSLAVLSAEHGEPRRWRYRNFSSGGVNRAEAWDSVTASAPLYAGSGWRTDGQYWRVVTRAETWNNQPVIVSVATPASLLASLRTQMRHEFQTRGLLLIGFGIFAVLFYRIVLLPFRDMRRRAADLSASGLLHGNEDRRLEDPEYVMATFDQLVRQLIEQADELERRATTSERRARTLERFNDYMLTSMTTGVVIVGANGVILQLNRAAEQILKVDPEDVMGYPFSEAGFYPEMRAVIEEGLYQGYVYSRREVRIERATSNGPAYLGINTSLIRDDHNDVVGLSVLLTDLTEIKKLYDDLAENQRLADLGEMAAGLAHQLRNSFAAILGYGRLLRNALPDGDHNIQWTQAILDETNETTEMVTRFLDFARPLEGDRSLLNVLDVIGEAVDTVAAIALANGVRITYPSDPALTPMQCVADGLLLKQVFVNLLQNALEAMPEGGTISIDASTRQTLPPRRPDVHVVITDSGSGIPEDIQTKIFHPFYTSKEAGTGLGLPLAKKIAIVHGGNLTLEQSSPEGSVFAVTLPAFTGTEEPAPLVPANVIGAGSR